MSPRTAAARALHRPRGAVAEPAREPARTRPPLRVVRPDEARRLRPGRVGTVAGVLLFAALFGLAAFQTVIIRNQGHLDDVTEQIQVEERRQQELELALADLQSPERITAAARALGMVTPGEVTYLQPTEGDDAAAAYEPPEPAADEAP